MKSLIFTLSLLCSLVSNSQYIAIRARYTETRTVQPDPLLPPSRENRLVLSFYHVGPGGVYIPASVTDYPVYVYKEGLQYGSFMGGVIDSTGNNYPGYLWTAPKAVSYYNSYGDHHIDCDPNLATAYTANGHELDCGFIRVSHWEEDPNNSTMVSEWFTAPNVCLTFYFIGDPYASNPGNVNFTWPTPPSPPYNWYSFACAGSTQQLVIRGVLEGDTASSVVLPVKIVNERGILLQDCRRKIDWTNMTESNLQFYEVQRSVDGASFTAIANILPRSSSGGREDYSYRDTAKLNAPKIYYRIRCVETSGVVFYSIVIPLTNGCHFVVTPRMSIYPNPAQNGRFWLNVTDLPSGNYSILIHNGASQVVRYAQIQHAGGTLNKLYELSYKAPGLYTVTLSSGDLVLSQKVLINN